jgi:threonine/homoserine/homoserine lactone efflux protein
MPGMDPTAAALAGLVAGLAIAMQFGAVSLLLVETSMTAGPRAGVAAGMGVATVDLAFACVAAAAGGAVGAALAAHEGAIKAVAAAVLAAIAIHGLLRVRDIEARPVVAAAARGLYARFLAITAANPLTIVSFAAVAAGLSLDGPGAAVAFAAGVGIASAGWHAVLTLAAGGAGRWMTPRVQRGLAIGGRLAVLAIAAHLVL